MNYAQLENEKKSSSPSRDLLQTFVCDGFVKPLIDLIREVLSFGKVLINLKTLNLYKQVERFEKKKRRKVTVREWVKNHSQKKQKRHKRSRSGMMILGGKYSAKNFRIGNGNLFNTYDIRSEKICFNDMCMIPWFDPVM